MQLRLFTVSSKGGHTTTYVFLPLDELKRRQNSNTTYEFLYRLHDSDEALRGMEIHGEALKTDAKVRARLKTSENKGREVEALLDELTGKTRRERCLEYIKDLEGLAKDAPDSIYAELARVARENGCN